MEILSYTRRGIMDSKETEQQDGLLFTGACTARKPTAQKIPEFERRLEVVLLACIASRFFASVFTCASFPDRRLKEFYPEARLKLNLDNILVASFEECTLLASVSQAAEHNS